jgi:hypothetical protein
MKLNFENMKGRYILEDIDVVERIILKMWHISKIGNNSNKSEFD